MSNEEEEEEEQDHHEDNEIPVEKLVKFIRMKNGEEIVTQLMTFTDDEDFYHIFVCPLKILFIETEGKSRTFILREWVVSEFCSEQEFTVYPDEMQLVGSASQPLIDHYFDALDRYGMNNSLKDRVNKNDIRLQTISSGIPLHSNTAIDLVNYNVQSKGIRN